MFSLKVLISKFLVMLLDAKLLIDLLWIDFWTDTLWLISIKVLSKCESYHEGSLKICVMLFCDTFILDSIPFVAFSDTRLTSTSSLEFQVATKFSVIITSYTCICQINSTGYSIG